MGNGMDGIIPGRHDIGKQKHDNVVNQMERKQAQEDAAKETAKEVSKALGVFDPKCNIVNKDGHRVFEFKKGDL